MHFLSINLHTPNWINLAIRAKTLNILQPFMRTMFNLLVIINISWISSSACSTETRTTHPSSITQTLTSPNSTSKTKSIKNQDNNAKSSSISAKVNWSSKGMRCSNWKKSSWIQHLRNLAMISKKYGNRSSIKSTCLFRKVKPNISLKFEKDAWLKVARNRRLR